MSIFEAVRKTPIVASLRGITQSQAINQCQSLTSGGITVLEVIVRSRECFNGAFPSESIKLIETIRPTLTGIAEVAAGSVSDEEDVRRLMDIGVTTFLSPFFRPRVVEFAASHGAHFFPGVETVSEAFQAMACGAKGVKLFPSIYREANGAYALRHTPGFVKYLGAFLPIPIIPSGDFGVDSHIDEYFASGAFALNVGKQLFSANSSPTDLKAKAENFSLACRKARDEANHLGT